MFKRISRNFEENFTQFLREFYAIFKSILRSFKENFTRKFHSILKKISRNFKVIFPQFLREFHAGNFTRTQLQMSI